MDAVEHGKGEDVALGVQIGEPGQVATGGSVWRRLALIAFVAGALINIGVIGAGSGMTILWAVAMTVALVFLTDDGVEILRRRRHRGLLTQVERFLGGDVTPGLVSDGHGRIAYCNHSAVHRFGVANGESLTRALDGRFAHPGAVLYRLQAQAATRGPAAEDVLTRRGSLRIAVQRIGPGHYLWRFEEFGDRAILARDGGDGISLPMLVVGRNGVILFANEAVRRLLGTRPRTLDRVFAEMPRHSGAIVTINSEAGPVASSVMIVDGLAERREFYLLPASITPPPPPLAAGVEDLPIALVQLAGSGAVVSANRCARELLGLRDGAAANATELFDGLGRPVRDWIADVAAGRLPGSAEVGRLRRAGPEVFVQIAAHPLPQGGVLAVVSDATALKTLEAQFVQSQKMQAIGQLAGGIAHDFNNLLTAITGHCDLLLLRHDPEDPDYADLAQISQNTNRAADLVGQLLAFSRKQTLEPARLCLDDVLGDVTHLLTRLVGERIRLDLVLDDAVGPVRADRRQLEQVLVNLVVNARDAMPGGGTIRIETAARTLLTPESHGRATLPPGDYAIIRVIDHGAGIPPELAGKIFEPFVTTKRPGEGTGLGLSTVYGIVKQSGGFIFADAGADRGTVFTLYLPVHDGGDAPEPASLPPPAPTISPAPDHAVVLLVEDEAAVRAFAARALQLHGHTVLEADSGEAALALLRDAGLKVDVFVTDVIMAGCDGPTWVREALLERPDARVVFMSGYAEDRLSAIREDLPTARFLPKPFSLDELTAAVAAVLA